MFKKFQLLLILSTLNTPKIKATIAPEVAKCLSKFLQQPSSRRILAAIAQRSCCVDKKNCYTSPCLCNAYCQNLTYEEMDAVDDVIRNSRQYYSDEENNDDTQGTSQKKEPRHSDLEKQR